MDKERSGGVTGATCDGMDTKGSEGVTGVCR
jgi:hypothetical protein